MNNAGGPGEARPGRGPGPRLRRVSPVVASVLGVLLGILITLVGVAAHRTRRTSVPIEPAPLLTADLRAVIKHLRTAGAVLGPHDELLVQSPALAPSGLVQGNRLVHLDALALVREARSHGEPGVLNLQTSPGPGLPQRQLAVRVAPLSEGLVLLLVDDRSQALRADESRRDFVTNVTHELKTPIGAIALLAEAIGEAAEDPEAVHRFADRLNAETARLNELVSQIIALSRLQAADPLLDASAVDVDELIDLVLDQARAPAEQGGITLARQGTRGTALRGDWGQIEAALRNLVQNAIAYSDPGARVTVTTRRVSNGGEWVELAVSDNGIGIAEADQPRVFERFFRVDYGRSRAHGGSGLGLSIVKHIAAAHGGTVRLWSHLGQGSTFTLRLPAHEPDTDAEGSAA